MSKLCPPHTTVTVPGAMEFRMVDGGVVVQVDGEPVLACKRCGATSGSEPIETVAQLGKFLHAHAGAVCGEKPKARRTT